MNYRDASDERRACSVANVRWERSLAGSRKIVLAGSTGNGCEAGFHLQHVPNVARIFGAIPDLYSSPLLSILSLKYELVPLSKVNA